MPNQFKTVCNYLQYAFVIFSHQKTKKKPNQSTNQKKKSKLDGLQKKKKKTKKKNK